LFSSGIILGAKVEEKHYKTVFERQVFTKLKEISWKIRTYGLFLS